jgi:hypothetical protein
MKLHETNPGTPLAGRDALAALRQFARTPGRVEQCELCGAELGSVHPHMLERKTLRISCSCDACAILFCGQEGARFLRIPQTVRAPGDFSLTDLEWEQLLIPIQLAFFVRTCDGRIIAMYPSAAGAIESQLSSEYLVTLFQRHPVLAAMQPEVEALLVNRVGKQHTYLTVPIDECFRLTGLIRTQWRGLSGGADVWGAIAQFLSELQQRSKPVAQEHHA